LNALTGAPVPVAVVELEGRAELVVAELVALAEPEAVAELVVLLLLPQPAKRMTSNATAAINDFFTGTSPRLELCRPASAGERSPSHRPSGQFTTRA
jgi:hypothetical protein